MSTSSNKNSSSVSIDELTRRARAARHAAESEWAEAPANVAALADWLVGLCHFPDQKRLLEFFREPTRWNREWKLFQLFQECEKAGEIGDQSPQFDVSEMIENALNDEDQTAEKLEYYFFHLDQTLGPYKLERRYKFNPPQPDEWSFAHEDYDGPGDPRCGVGKSLTMCIDQIQEIERERTE